MSDAARSRMEAALVDRCVIKRRAAAPPTFDRPTGNLTEAAPTTVYIGPCLVSVLMADRQVENRGGEGEHRTRYQVSVPITADPVAPDDLITVTACAADPDLVDRELRAVSVAHGSLIIRRRITADLVDVGVEA
jgi:hypothetical protein